MRQPSARRLPAPSAAKHRLARRPSAARRRHRLSRGHHGAEPLEARLLLSAAPAASLAPVPTTITVTSLPSTTFGQKLTLTAQVSSTDTPPSEGTVTFFDGSVALSSVPVSNGVAAFESSELPAGNAVITAAYSDAAGNFGPSQLAVNSAARITTFAGNGGQEYDGDGSQPTAASLNFPQGVAVDSAGDVFILDKLNNVVREVNRLTGQITTVAGNGSFAVFSPSGGAATAASFSDASGIAVDAAGDLLIADDGDHEVLEVNAATGLIAAVAGNGIAGDSGDGGTATAAQLNYPDAVAVDAAGDIFVADSRNNEVLKINPATSIITTIAGGGSAYGDGGPATDASLLAPTGLAVDSAGDVFIADSLDDAIREVTPGGAISTVAGNGTLSDNGNGGPATNAGIGIPRGVAVDKAGDLFIASANNDVREVTPNGLIWTVGGSGTAGFGGDGGPAINAQLSLPDAVAVDGAGNVFVADANNNRVREITAGVIVTINRATPVVTVSDAGGRYSTLPFPATATVAGIISGVDTTPAASLESVTPTFTFYAGSSVSGLGSLSAPTQPGTYTVVASFPGSVDYLPVDSSPAVFNVTESANSPTSKITSSSVRSSVVSIPVSWSGTPGSGGSPIESYTIFVSTDGAPPIVWLAGTTATSASFAGIIGNSYGFSSTAQDTGGNVELAHATADATVVLSSTPWHNSANPLDVLGTGGAIVPLDALIVINMLNNGGPRAFPNTANASANYPDVLGTNKLQALDALQIINFLNQPTAQTAVKAAPLAATGLGHVTPLTDPLPAVDKATAIQWAAIEAVVADLYAGELDSDLLTNLANGRGRKK